MTPQLQQAIKLLQLSRIELVEQIQQELGENPALEEKPESANEKDIYDATEFFQYLDSDNYHKKHSSGFEAKDSVSFETYTPSKTSLAEHLLWQLMMNSPTPEDEKIGSLIVGSLDDKGYLKSSIEEIAEMSGSELHRVTQVLTLMQSFDPIGVCARDLKECLLIQARDLGHEDSIVSDIIANHLNDIEKRDYKSIAICAHGGTIAGLKRFIVYGEYNPEDLYDFPVPGVLVEIKNKKVLEKDFNSN